MSRKGYRDRTKFLAKLVTENRKPCAFCQREVDDEITYGKLYSIGDIQCHYFCVLLSCCLVQKGKDEDGLFGFLYPDILAELERSKKHKCSFCNKEGATLGCCVSQCRKQFHLPCGRERQAVSLFYGNYKSFCKNHAPKQKVTDNVMAKAKLRMQASRKSTKPVVVKQETDDDDSLKAETVCVICYEDVECYPTPQTFWPPCCARDAWFHRSCVQRMSLSAGMHYLKCPLCNDKENFYQAVISQGFYVPDRDAAWELEQNAFAEIYERELRCARAQCVCPRGREYDADNGPWDIKLCLLCGSAGAHAQCLLEDGCAGRFVCATCTPAAPEDLDQLAISIENVIVSEQAAASRSRGPVMSGRMSLRRTKRRLAAEKTPRFAAQTSASLDGSQSEAMSNTTASRQELNLTTPRRGIQGAKREKQDSVLKDIENKLFSPVKMIEQGLKERVKDIGNGMENLKLESSVVEKVRAKFRKPKPLSEKKKIVDGILNDLVNNILKESSKVKEPVRAWCSPKKDSIQEIEHELLEKDTKTADLKIKEKTTESPKKTEYIKKRTISNKDGDVSPNTVIEVDEPSDTSHNNSALHIDKTEDPKLENEDTVSINSDLNAKESPKKCEGDIEIKNEDDSSNSTFQLAPEFVAEESNDSVPTFDTPKKLKTVEIKKDSSMEISENNDVVNIDVITMADQENDEKREFLKNFNLQSPIKKSRSEKCAFKFSPNNKEAIVCNKMDIDVESFKNQYLNEVDRDFKCNFNHKHQEKSESPFQLRTAIDFAIDAAFKTENRKRKMKSRKIKTKRRKNSDIVLKYENLDSNRRKIKKNKTTKVSIQNDNMKVKISLKKEKFKLRIMQSKFESAPKTLKQYVLKYSDGSSIGKPEKDVTPIKRKYVKLEKSPDNLKQMSIQSFFKSKD